MNRNSLWCEIARVTACAGLGLLACLSCAQAGTTALAYREQVIELDGEARRVRVPEGYLLEWLAAMDAPRMLRFAPTATCSPARGPARCTA